MKLILFTFLLILSNTLLSQQLIINSGIDSIFKAAENSIFIKSDSDNFVLHANAGDLEKVADHYYTFKICHPSDTFVRFTLSKVEKTLSVIKEFKFKIAGTPEPVISFEGREVYPVGLRVLPKNGVTLVFTVKSYQFEVIKKDGTKFIFKNYGTILTGEAYLAYRQLEEGESFGITNVIARKECETEDIRINGTIYQTVRIYKLLN